MLIVCTGNICRSAFAERLGRAYLRERYGREDVVRLVSAGTSAVVGSAMHPNSEFVLNGFGAAGEGFRARQFEPDMAARADLVLTMTRAHRDAVLAAVPRALARTFTLREFAGLLTDAEQPATPVSNEAGDPHRIVARAAAQRSHRRSDAEDDIADPIGRPLDVHEDVGGIIAAAMLRVLDHLAGASAEAPSGR